MLDARCSIISSRPSAGTPGHRTPEPHQQGRLLLWRECFLDASWASGQGAELFGTETGCRSMLETIARSGISLEDLLFLDLETCGLADAPVFLTGAMTATPLGWELVQWLAPDPSAEPELVSRSFDLLERKSVWVSFNGKSFDLPRLRRRGRLHGMAPPEGANHRDLLHEVRHRWKGELPDCRLTTVERRLLGLARFPGDVPGREIPERYRDFVRSGDRRWLDPVIEHNRRDVAALAALLVRLLDDGAALV